jgi:hypothetical protein
MFMMTSDARCAEQISGLGEAIGKPSRKAHALGAIDHAMVV